MSRRTPEQLAAAAEANVRREKARLQLESLKLRREATKSRRRMLAVHRAAQVNRLTNDWYAPATSADSAIVADLARVNARARQMVRDDPWAKSICRSFQRNVVGSGITPILDDKPYRQAWEDWSEHRESVDIERRRSFVQIQQWAINEVVTVGECFIVRWQVRDRYQRQLKLQCFEFEQLDNYKFYEASTRNEIRHGIEIDEHGAAVAFHFWRRHPNDIRGMARPTPMTQDSIRIPASMVCHIYDPERVRQTHGISRLAPVLRKLRDLSEYDAAQLQVARAEASIGILIKGNEDADDKLELNGISVAYLGEDEDVTSFTPSRPGGTYQPFIEAQLKSIAAGVGISYPQIARDFAGGSFSSQRQNDIEDRREWEPLQHMIASVLCVPVMNDFVELFYSQHPEVSGDYYLSTAPERVEWVGQGWEWVDPEQQGKGVERMMRLGLTTRTLEAQKLGRTVLRLNQQAARDGTQQTLQNLKPDKRESPAPEAVTNAD